MKVQPKPAIDITITKFGYGKECRQSAKSSLYDPRAPSDRNVDKVQLNKMLSNLSQCLSSSSVFLFHDVKPTPLSNSCIQIDSLCETVPENVEDVFGNAEESNLDLPFNDDYNINDQGALGNQGTLPL